MMMMGEDITNTVLEATTTTFKSGSNAASNVLDYITIATTGDATDFGDSSDGRGHAACSGD